MYIYNHFLSLHHYLIMLKHIIIEIKYAMNKYIL